MRLSLFLASLLLAAGAAPAQVIVRGTVADEAGGAVEGARIELFAATTAFERDAAELAGAGASLPLAVARSAPDGTFALSAEEPGVFRVVVSDRGRLTLERTIGPVVESRDLETARLSRTIDLTVTVVDPRERPVAGAHVRVSFAGLRDEPLLSRLPQHWRPRDRTGVTGADGRVVLPIGEDEAARVVAFHPGFLESVEERLEILTETVLRLEGGAARTLEVEDAASRPVPGALVRVGATVLGMTGGDGRIELTVPLDGVLRVNAETASGQYGQTAVQAPHDGETAPAVLVLNEPVRLSGRVIDGATKRPVAQAWAAFGDAVARTSADGTFVLPVRSGGPQDLLHAAAPGYLPAAAVAGGEEGERVPELVLRPWAALDGIVVDEADAPIAGAEVVVARGPEAQGPAVYLDEGTAMRLAARYSGAGNFTRSDAEGHFRLRLSPKELYDLEVRKPGFLPTLAEDLTPGGESRVVVLRRGRLGVGRVLDLDERPVAGATVRLWPAARDSRGRRESTSWESATDAEGRFELRELRPGPALLRASAPGFAPLAVEGVNVVFDPGAEEVDLGTLLLEPGVRVAGRVVDPRGRPLAGVKVAYEPWSTEGDLKPWELDVTEVSTGEDGGFAIGDLVAGEKLDLTAWHIDYATTEAHGVECPTEDLELVLEPTAKVRGRVVGPGGVPVEEGRVHGYYQALNGGRLSQDSAVRDDGSFELAYLGSRGVEIEAEARGFRSRRLWLELEPGEVVEGIVIELEPGAVIEGAVLGPGGGPAAGVRIVPPFFRDRAEVTDALGRFVLGGLELGPCQIRVVPAELPPVSRTVDVKPGVNPVEIRLEEGFEVHGRVLDAAGTGVPGVRVSLAASSAATGEDGSFAFDDVPRGVHRLAAAKRGFAFREVPDVTVDGPIWDLEVVLEREGTIAGLVLGLEALSLARVQIWASSLDDQWAEGRVDYEGRYRLGPLSPGDWRVEAMDAVSGRTARGSVEVAAGATAELDLEFVPGLLLTGEVRLDGEPESGGMVRLQGLDVVAGGRARTDWSGAFRFEGLRPGRYRAVVLGTRKELLEVREIELAGDEHVVFDLATGELRGRTVDAADGRPLEDAELALEPAAAGRSGETIRAETDAGGRFRFTRLAAGRYLLRAEREGYGVDERLVEVEAGVATSELAVELQRTSGVVLEVKDAAGGPPPEIWAAAFAGTAAVGEPVLSGRFLVTNEGTARLASLPPGTWTLVVRSPGSGTVRLTVPAPGDVVPVRLPPGTRLEIEVPELAGGELATIEVAGADGGFVSVASGGGVRRRWLSASGWTAIEGLPPGRFSVAVSAREHAWTGSAVAPAGGGSVRLELE